MKLRPRASPRYPAYSKDPVRDSGFPPGLPLPNDMRQDGRFQVGDDIRLNPAIVFRVNLQTAGEKSEGIATNPT